MLRGSIINYYTYNFTSHIKNVVFPIVCIPFGKGWKVSSPLTHPNGSPPFAQVIHRLLLVPLTELSGLCTQHIVFAKCWNRECILHCLHPFWRRMEGELNPDPSQWIPPNMQVINQLLLVPLPELGGLCTQHIVLRHCHCRYCHAIVLPPLPLSPSHCHHPHLCRQHHCSCRGSHCSHCYCRHSHCHTHAACCQSKACKWVNTILRSKSTIGSLIILFPIFHHFELHILIIPISSPSAPSPLPSPSLQPLP